MGRKGIDTVNRVYEAAMSVITVLVGVCLAAACVDIYREGNGFSAYAVTERFRIISPAVYVWIAFFVVGVVLHFIFPKERLRAKMGGNVASAIKRLYGKFGGVLPDAALKEQKKRKVFYAVQVALLAVGSAVFFVYSLNGENFGHDMNSSVIKTAVVMLICLFLPFCWAVISMYLCEASRKRELAVLKTSKPAAADCQSRAVNKEKTTINIVRTAIFVMGIAFLIYGICTDGVSAVLTKAVNICTECIGLG